MTALDKRSVVIYKTALFGVDWRVPQATGRVLEDGGPLGVPGLRVLIGLSLPARVRDDHLVGHGLQRMINDHHLQRLVRG